MEVREPSAKYLVKAGYKQTEVGVIPEDWDSISAAEFVDSNAPICYGVVQVGQDTNGGVPIVAIKHVKEISFAPLHRTAPELERPHLRSRVQRGDVLISIKGTIGRVGIVPQGFEGNISRELARLRAKEEYSPEYIAHQLEADTTQARILKAVVGTTRLEFSIATLRKFALPIPPTLSEQSAIAEALSDADALIKSLDQLLAKKRQIKQGAMQELLTGQKRLPGFSGEWEQKPMHMLGQTYGGLTGKSKADFGHGSARYIPFMNVMNSTVIDPNWLESVDVVLGESQNLALMGDLFFNGSSETPEEVGFCSVLQHDVSDVYLNSFCFGFRFHEATQADGLFLSYWFRSQNGRKAMSLLAQGATRYNIAKSAFLKLKVPQPSSQEQTAIATVLADMDAEIAALEARLAKARLLKQGMMQALLTGRIRLV